MYSAKDQDKINGLIEKIFSQIATDNRIEINEKMQIIKELQDYKQSLVNFSNITKEEINLAIEYENQISIDTLLSKVRQRDFDYPPSYINQFIKAISISPFTIPSTLFELDGKTKVKIKLPNKEIKEEDIGLSLTLLFPGSITYRYDDLIKIKTGDWSHSWKAHLRSNHILSENPIFNIPYNNLLKDVYEPLVLHSIKVDKNPITHQYNVCKKCLTISDKDEDCEHMKGYRNKTPFSKVRILKKYISSEKGNQKKFNDIIYDIIENVTYLENLKIGITAIGFERGMDKKNIFIEYDPFIGQLLETKGLNFTIKNQNDKIKEILENYKWIERDIIIQILANKFLFLLKSNFIPEYEFERLFSLLINLLKVNNEYLLDFNETNSIISDLNKLFFNEIEQYNETIENKIEINEHLKKLIQDFSFIRIIEEDILQHANITYIHTLSHLILIACCITSGSEFNDIDYTIDNNQIIIFDKIPGGNGVSDLVFEFLSKEEEFELEKEIKNEFEKSTIMNPRYFDSVFFEFLLPCMNSVVERTFFNTMDRSSHYEFIKRWSEIEQRFKNREQLIENIKKIKVENSFPYLNSITDDNSEELDDLDIELIKEAIDICIHGCPECSILGNQCQYGSRLEKFNISKIIQSLILEKIIDNYVCYDKIEKEILCKKIKTILNKKGVTFLKLKYTMFDPSEIEEAILSVS